MSDRIEKLRHQTINTAPSINLERAGLLTAFYKSGQADAQPVQIARALAFRYILENKALIVNDGELIVGERGPKPKATSTYPEICTHSQKDFEILNSRAKVSFKVDRQTFEQQEKEIAPYWKGQSIRDQIFAKMDADWLTAYDAGIFTEFQEQRAPGHTVLDDKIYKNGFLNFKNRIQSRLAQLTENEGKNSEDQKNQLTAMSIACDAIMLYAIRYAEKLSEMAISEPDQKRKTELTQMAEICRHVPAHAPRNLWEALQSYWFVHLGVIIELNTWDSFNPGRLDQHLFPFYTEGLADKSLTKDWTIELLQSFWIKFNNQPAPPKVGVTALESNTYTDFCLINVGGVDVDGADGSNEMTYILLDVIEKMRILQPSSMVQVSRKSPDKLLHRALKIIKTGFGQPSLFNTDAIIKELTRQGKTLVDARCGGASGCVEAGAFGKESYILTGYFNIPKVLEVTLFNGTDPRSGKLVGIKTGKIESFKNFDQLYSAFEKQLSHFIEIKIKGNLVIEKLWGEILPSPFLSILIDDCIEAGLDYNCGGARYNSSYIQGVGVGTTTDCLAAIKYHIFDQNSFDFETLMSALKNNFDGDEPLRQVLISNSPKYGNDDDYADDIWVRLFESYFNLIDNRPNYKGGQFRVNLLPTTCHVYFGSVMGASPDGRKAGLPISEGISPVQGADRFGPTAVLKSAAKIDQLKTGGTLLNQKFTPEFFESDKAIKNISDLVRTYFEMNGHHIQFNVVDARTLRQAQKDPDAHRDLIVRVAGYSDYFVELGVPLQDEIIRRTEQTAG